VASATLEAPHSYTKAQFPKKLQPLFTPSRYKILHGGRGGAKCLALGTRVIMADGSLRAVEDVQLGEQVMGPDSKPRTVLSTTRGTGPLYRVVQTSGMAYVVNEHHILSLKKSVSSKRDVRLMPSGNLRSPQGRYPDWEDTTNISVSEFVRQSKQWQSHFLGYRAGLLNFDKRAIDIEPYLLGLWLGDGTGRELRITSADEEVIAYCREYAAMRSGSCSVIHKPGHKAKDIGLSLRHGRYNSLWEPFKRYSLKNNKHIPHDYLTNSEEVRLKLLAGLVDSDGAKHHGGYVIAQTNERLARDIKYLADTLGFRTSLNLRKTVCSNNGACGVAWYVSISGDTWRIPCLVPRKRVDVGELRKNKNFLLSQVSVEPVGEGEWAGFSLDGDHLFLLEDGTVTHNSWGVARALLIKGASQRLRVLCCREVQDSIKDSVHKLLKDQIELLGMGSVYDVLRDEIRGHNGTEFLFSGLSDLTAESIKSFEGVDIVWVEEAQSVSKNSWTILIPTIRKEKSEIWMTMNIILTTDDTYVRFIENTPPDSIVIEINYRDNPWFSTVLDQERLHCKATETQEEYEHIWEGKPRITLAGAIYAREVAAMIREGRYAPCPYDPRLKVHTIWDLGWNDAMAIGLVQRARSEVRFIAYYEDSYKKTDEWAAELNKLPYNWGWDYLPFDGFSHDRRSGSNDYKILKAFGRKVKPENESIPKMDLESGIRSARNMLAVTVLNKGGVGIDRLMEVLKRYRRHISKTTNEPGAPVHDEFSHGADMVRHTSLVRDKLSNEDEGMRRPVVQSARPMDSSMGLLG